jgi:anti-sigma B factor antagonist
MNLSDSLDGDVAIINLGGRLASCEELKGFLETIHAYLNSNVRRFVIDLSGVENTESEGLGSLIAAYTSVRKADGRFVLANITNVRNLLTITKLYGVFEAYESRDEALKAVRS